MPDSIEKHIRELYRSCGRAGWDGRSAAPMSAKCAKTALSFAKKVPPKFPAPSASVMACGTLELEWFGGAGSSIKIRFKGDGAAVYEAKKSGKLRSGTMPCPEVFEEILADAIRSLARPKSPRP